MHSVLDRKLCCWVVCMLRGANCAAWWIGGLENCPRQHAGSNARLLRASDPNFIEEGVVFIDLIRLDDV
jgi:hypothetical protein